MDDDEDDDVNDNGDHADDAINRSLCRKTIAGFVQPRCWIYKATYVTHSKHKRQVDTTDCYRMIIDAVGRTDTRTNKCPTSLGDKHTRLHVNTCKHHYTKLFILPG